MSGLDAPAAAVAGFLGSLFSGANGHTWKVRPDSSTTGVTSDHSLIQQMIGRLLEHQPFALPNSISGDGPPRDRWLVAGGGDYALAQAMQRISQALAPDYAWFPDDGNTACRHQFENGRGPLQTAGALLFPQGYYRFETHRQDREVVVTALQRWALLQDEAPVPPVEVTPNYRELVGQFESATAAGRWGDANDTISLVERLNLTSGENLLFMKIALLARQQRWAAIWRHQSQDKLLRLRMPRAIRAAMLSALYNDVLRPLEESDGVAKALAAYNDVRPQLGSLLAGRAGLDLPEVIQVFGYEAVAVDDRAAFDELVAVADLSTRHKLDALRGLLSKTEPPPPEPGGDLADRIRAAFAAGDIDEVFDLTRRISDPVAQVAARIEAAAQVDDEYQAAAVIRQFRRLSEEQQEKVLATDPAIVTWYGHLLDLSGLETDVPVDAPQIEDWSDWCIAARETDDAHLRDWLAQVEGTLELAMSSAWAKELAEAIEYLYIMEDIARRPVLGHAIERIASELTASTGFPHVGRDEARLYEVVFEAMAKTPSRTEKHTLAVLALAEAVLRNHPEFVGSAAQTLRTWFHRPTPAYDELALEAAELLVEYGVAASTLGDYIRSWTGGMLASASSWDRNRMVAWRQLADWASAGDDILMGLNARIMARPADPVDPIASLPPRTRIAIFTLRPLAAERAKTLLLQRNRELRIEVCDEKEMSQRVRVLAAGADIPVIVTSCTKHAIFYGVVPALRPGVTEVYPRSQGSSSLIDAIAERASIN